MEGFDPVRLAYTTHEPVGGADPNLSPVIFLHGLGGFKEYWEDIPQTIANATKRLCYSVDARNHGDSEWSDEFSFDLNANDLIHFMDVHGIERGVLVGHSMGGITATRAALKAPSRVESVVVEDMYAQNLSREDVDRVEGYLHVMKQALEEAPADFDEEGVKKFILQHIFVHMPPEMIEQFEGQRRKDVDPEQLTRFIGLKRGAWGRHTFKFNMEVILKAVQNRETLQAEPRGVYEGPACFVFGQMSPFYKAVDQEETKKLFPNAVQEVVEKVGHDIHISKPLEFVGILLKFLS